MIVDFLKNVFKRKILKGHQDFLACRCQNADEPSVGWFPVVCYDEVGPIIIALVCANCQSEIAIQNGRIKEVDHD